MLSDLSDEEIDVKTGVKISSKYIELIKRKNELRALERHVINIIFNLGGEPAEDSEEICTLLRRRALRLLMEEKAAKIRADPRWTEYKRVSFRRSESRSTESRGNAPRRTDGKCCKSARHRNAKLTKLQRIESVRVEQVKRQWTEIQQVEHQTHITEFQQAAPTQQWVECVLLEPSEATPVLLTPVEIVQPEYTEIQKVTEVTVVKKIRIYEEIIEG